ncbi:MAG TPA: efflux RND transporter periplasmic adaptor subunit [Thermoanaerobaculia bacterium]|nr:efflux RND transporter periplasmic adaptor subunit [Thermoanaerobaculia bacterium]
MIAETLYPRNPPADIVAEPTMDTDLDQVSEPGDALAPVATAPTADPDPAIATHGARGAPGTDGASEALDTPSTAADAPRRRLTRWHWALLVAAIAVAATIAVRLLPARDVAGGPSDMDRAIPVRTAAVTQGALDVFSSYPGELVGEVSDIAPRVGGLLQEVPVRIGDRVAKGSVLAVVDDVNLRNQFQEAKGQHGVAVANERRAAAELDSVAADHRRAVGLSREQLLSEQDFERVTAQLASSRASLAAAEAQTAQAQARLALLEQQLQDSRVVAPFAGTVAARYLDRGAMVQAGTPILRLVEAAPLVVQFRVPERDLDAVRPGASFSVKTQATNEIFDGVVRRVSGEVSRTDRTAVVEGELAEHDGLLKPGMYAEVRLRVRALQGALLVPDVALLERVTMAGEQTTGVFRVASSTAGDDTATAAQWITVEVAGRSGSQAAISGDLTVNDRVLTLGHTELQDGAAIRVVQEQRQAPSTVVASPEATP